MLRSLGPIKAAPTPGTLSSSSICSTACFRSICRMIRFSRLASSVNDQGAWAAKSFCPLFTEQPRLPSGGKSAHSTIRSTSARVSMRGTMNPCAPRSRTRVIRCGTLSGTRTSGVMPASRATRTRSATVS